MKRKRNYTSVQKCIKEIEKIDILLNGLITSIEALNILKDNPNIPKFKDIYEKHKEFFEFDEVKINSIYELAFIRLYATFECFMYDLLRELYTKYPESLPKDRKIDIEYILEWKTQKSIKDFIIDHISIENSYDLLNWEKTLEKSFNIKIFKDNEEKEGFLLINLVRNMVLHSGGSYNSKVYRDTLKLFPENKNKKKKEKFEVSKADWIDKRSYDLLRFFIFRIFKNIE